jgi:chemotaxis protein histidine kinase CheA
MAPRDDKPGTRSYADHEIITPPNRLVKAIAGRGGNGDADPVARAQAAVEALAGDFRTWMQEECDRLQRARLAALAQGFDPARLGELFRAAHDIKGGAATFGYPLVAPVAESLCRLIEHTPESGQMPAPLLEQHVDAIRAIVREYARPDIQQIAGALNARLQSVTRDFLVRANAHRPDYLDGIFPGPPR